MIHLFTQVFGLKPDQVNDDLDFEAISTWDSLSHMQFITLLEETYKIQLSGDEIADMRSVGTTRATLQAHGVTL
jgi:acyl carrier protein